MPADKLLSIRIEDCNPGHTLLRVWQHAGMAGLLTVQTKHAAEVIYRMTNCESPEAQAMIAKAVADDG